MMKDGVRMASTTYSSGERIDYASILDGRTKILILAGVLVCLFLAALDQTIVGTALPAIVRDLNGLDMVAWISTGYLLASTTMVPIYGKLSDLYGRRAILVWGVIVFLLGSMLCGIATTMMELIAFRVIQGIGAAALTSTAFAVPADLFAPAERARYMGIFGGVFGLSSVIGPFLGGLLTDQFSWHWVFYVNLPLGIAALIFILTKMPKLNSGIKAPIDWIGTILMVIAVVPLLLGLTLDKAVYPWDSPLVIGLFSTAAVGTVLFLWAETRAPSPIIALSLFRNRTFAVVISASVLNGAAFFGAILFLSLYLVNVVGLSATEAGTAQIPLMVAFVAGSILSSQIVARVGRYKPFIIGGFAIMLLGMLAMTQLNVHSTTFDVTWRMLVLGIGIGPAMPLLNLAMQNDTPFQMMGSATANRQFFQQLGQAIGATIFGLVLTTTLTAQITQNVSPVIAELPAAVQSQFDPAHFRQNVAAEAPTAQQADLSAKLVPVVGEEQARKLGAEIGDALKLSFSNSVTRIYFYAVWPVLIAFLLVIFFLPEKPLRKTNRTEAPPPTME